MGKGNQKTEKSEQKKHALGGLYQKGRVHGGVHCSKQNVFGTILIEKIFDDSGLCCKCYQKMIPSMEIYHNMMYPTIERFYCMYNGALLVEVNMISTFKINTTVLTFIHSTLCIHLYKII
jgi:hypothetical protein